MSQQDIKTERVQVTLPCTLLTQCRQIAEQSGLTLSKVLEHFARSGVQQGLTLTFSPSSHGDSQLSASARTQPHTSPTAHRGSKQTSTHAEARVCGDETIEELLGLPDATR